MAGRHRASRTVANPQVMNLIDGGGLAFLVVFIEATSTSFQSPETYTFLLAELHYSSLTAVVVYTLVPEQISLSTIRVPNVYIELSGTAF